MKPDFLIAREAIEDELEARRKRGDPKIQTTKLPDWKGGPKRVVAIGVGIMQCPLCKTGNRWYSRANNGHIWSRCSSSQCVAWME